MITIDEVYDFNLDEDDVLTVEFSLEGDPDNTYRELKSGAYHQWAKDGDTHRRYHFVEQICNHPDEHGHSEYVFDFEIWKEYEHDEAQVVDFLEEHLDAGTLPLCQPCE